MEHVSHRPHCASPAFGSRPRLTHRLTQAVSWVESAFRTARERRLLMALDECALKDIGVSKADAEAEWSRPFWDLPRGQ